MCKFNIIRMPCVRSNQWICFWKLYPTQYHIWPSRLIPIYDLTHGSDEAPCHGRWILVILTVTAVRHLRMQSCGCAELGQGWVPCGACAYLSYPEVLRLKGYFLIALCGMAGSSSSSDKDDDQPSPTAHLPYVAALKDSKHLRTVSWFYFACWSQSRWKEFVHLTV